ncbi:MAG: hypothetical protein OZSIB_0787 [Candidatus Ozemobacter sibiricus]|uniref:Uncharacterized protein n=1 Tax=Candidatus Ozemobacter sibiricus TaxID=2268124 RepID=A0A367ZU30_9BACT|nr:MAG: hypothetical protein OZSIB_0787 [Candidatus Ozemobacter sibiricus]
MKKIILDFSFDQRTGETKIVVDYEDPELSTLELNEAIRSGEIRDEVIALAGRMFGDDVAGRLRDGRIPLVCLDHHPELREQPTAVAQSQTEAAPRRQDQTQ